MTGKPLLPSLRMKKRYIVYESIDDDPFKKIRESFLHHFGTIAYGMAGIKQVMRNGNRGILKVNNNHTDKLRASIALADRQIRTIHVSGILKKAKTEIGG